jgi:hypothetical protein
MMEYIAGIGRGYPLSMLNQTSSSGPCLVFVNSKCKEEYDSVRSWLNKSRYNTYEATDVFDAMEEMYDFMGSEVPDVIVVPGSADGVSSLVEERVFVYSSGVERPGCIHNLSELADELDTYFPPKTAPTKRASA